MSVVKSRYEYAGVIVWGIRQPLEFQTEDAIDNISLDKCYGHLFAIVESFET